MIISEFLTGGIIFIHIIIIAASILIQTLVLSIYPRKECKKNMDAEEIAKKCSMNDLRPLAKKYGIPTRCVKKIDIIRSLPPEALTELEKK